MLAASKADQVSFESTEFKNGIFTHFLITSISPANDNDFNKTISSSELYYATRQSTLDYSKKHFIKEQEPIFIDMIEGNLDLFYLPNNQNKKTNGNQDLDSLQYIFDQEKDMSKKIELYKKIYDTDPNNVFYTLKMSSLYANINNELKAIECLKHLNSIYKYNNSISIICLKNIAELYKKIGNKELALYYYTKAIKIEPKNPKLNNEIAAVYLSNFDTISAMQHLNKSLANQPFQKAPYLSLFYLHLHYSNFKVANTIIKKSYRINSHDFATLYWYTLSQKFIEKSSTNDSIFYSIEETIGIKKKWAKISENKPPYYISYKRISKDEKELYVIQEAINDYPYYDGFYMAYIQYVKDNNIDKDLKSYVKKYLLYSKLNPDYSFINKYIK